LLADLAARGGGDLIGDFAALLPMAAISRMLGVPEADQDELRGWADAMVHREDGVQGVPDSAKQAAADIYAYFESLLIKRRVDDGDDLLSLLLAAGAQGDITHLEIIGFCYLLIIAGNETSTKLIGNMAYQLCVYPDQKLCVLNEPTLVPNTVEEVLRFDPVTHMMARTLTTDVELHGRRMAAGTKVALLLASANRDERFWTSPDLFDVHRHDAKEHLAFGFGIHHCIGAALARLEARVALAGLLHHMPGYVIEEVGRERMHSGNVRGFARLPVMVG